MLLLKYFSAWKTHCEATSIVRKNDALIEAISSLFAFFRDKLRTKHGTPPNDFIV